MGSGQGTNLRDGNQIEALPPGEGNGEGTEDIEKGPEGARSKKSESNKRGEKEERQDNHLDFHLGMSQVSAQCP